MSLSVLPGGPPVGVALGVNGAVVTNYGGGSLSYSDTEAPFVAEGTIAAGSTATLYGTQFFTTVAGAVLEVRTLASNVETLETRLDLIDDVSPDLEVFRASLMKRDLQPVVMVTLGSSTTSGSDATTPEKRYVNRLVRIIQAEYMLESGTHPDLIALGGTATAVRGLLGVNGGIAGTTSADYLSAPTITQIGALNPSLVTHMVAGNDYYTSVPVATFKANVLAQLAALRAVITVPCVHLLIQTYQRFDVAQGSRPAWAAYGDALREIAAAAADVTFADLSAAYLRVGIPSADPLDLVGTDSVHQNDLGHAFMAETLRRAMGFSKATPPVATMTFSDDFTRADGVPSNGWFASNFAIASNQVTSTALADSTLSRSHVADLGYVQGRVKAGLGMSSGVHFRRANDDSLIRFSLRASAGNLTYTLATFGPSSSNLNVIGTSLIVPALNDLLRVEYSGTTIRCYVNGVLVITATSSWNQAELGAGFRTFVSATAATSWDDFAMGTILS